MFSIEKNKDLPDGWFASEHAENVLEINFCGHFLGTRTFDLLIFFQNERRVFESPECCHEKMTRFL